MRTAIRCFTLVAAAAAIQFKPIDWEALERIDTKPIQLQMKTFSADGLDVEGPILAEGRRDAAEFEHEKQVMDEAHKNLRAEFEREEQGLPAAAVTDYVPKLKKLDLDTE